MDVAIFGLTGVILKFIEHACRKYLRRRGYAVPKRKSVDIDGDYVLAQTDEDYGQYVARQTKGNHEKIDQVWADEQTIDVICDYLKAGSVPIKAGLCHGSRNGTEVRWFEERLGIDVVGTDISDTAAAYGLVQWDFHKVKPEWIGKFDFIYTNSHDHAHDPKLAFSTWVDQLSPAGKLFVEHTIWHSAEGVTELDPFGVDPRVLPYVLLNFSEGRFGVTRILRPSHVKRKSNIWVFVVQRLP